VGGVQDLLLKELQPQINTGIAWKELLARYHEGGRTDALRDTVRRSMASAGIPPDYIARFLEGMSSLTPERAERAFNEWRKQVEFSAVQRKAFRNKCRMSATSNRKNRYAAEYAAALSGPP